MFWLIGLLALATSLPLFAAKDLSVWDPMVLYPNSGAVWHMGRFYNVTWDTSNSPPQITNPNGTIYLVQNGRILLDSPLASGFQLEAGHVEIQVPNVTAGPYQIDLFGDSGNWGELFTIEQ